MAALLAFNESLTAGAFMDSRRIVKYLLLMLILSACLSSAHVA
jgi:hypothetical protein